MYSLENEANIFPSLPVKLPCRVISQQYLALHVGNHIKRRINSTKRAYLFLANTDAWQIELFVALYARMII